MKRCCFGALSLSQTMRESSSAQSFEVILSELDPETILRVKTCRVLDNFPDWTAPKRNPK
ncbi:MAG: hypothetical protein DMF71_06195 [Acidobacteria bacterium]|nr:MAG: hypothetical protein DMF71_06195 [Acidobacteriota bacterium]